MRAKDECLSATDDDPPGPHESWCLFLSDVNNFYEQYAFKQFGYEYEFIDYDYDTTNTDDKVQNHILL